VTSLARILGANKTGTSTATAIVNAHPRAHMLYEIDFAAPADCGRNGQFVSAYPNTAHLFSSGFGLSYVLAEVLRLNPSLSQRFDRAFGTKVPKLVADSLNDEVATIFTIRNVRSWICKNSVIKEFLGDDVSSDIVPLMVKYTDLLLASFTHPRTLRLRLEDLFIGGGVRWTNAIGAFLDLETFEIENWWEKRAEIWAAGAAHSDWAAFHDSAFIKPEQPDTDGAMRPHPAWNAVLPIFDKYFENLDATFSQSEIAADRKTLAQIPGRLSLSLAAAYVRRMSWSHQSQMFVDAFRFR
jgi:hypothetical protein